MNPKLLAMWQQVKTWALYAASKWPLPVGIALGYFFHPEIKLILDMACDLLKAIFKFL